MRSYTGKTGLAVSVGLRMPKRKVTYKEPGICENCDYKFTVPHGACPECGFRIETKDITTAQRLAICERTLNELLDTLGRAAGGYEDG